MAFENSSVKTPAASMASRGPTVKDEHAPSLMGNPGSPAPLRLTENHREPQGGGMRRVGYGGPIACQAPPKALSHTLSHCSFTRPAEEGSTVVREPRRKASHS